jgi:type IV pilus biogenesis protein CpaD/CtpE
MSDAPTGNNGGRNFRSQENSSIDLAVLAVDGGTKYVARLRQIEEAYAKLNIGQNAHAALALAQRKRDEADAFADASRTQVARTLAEADAKSKLQVAKADEIVAKAKAQQKEVDERIKEVEARERAAVEIHAKAEGAHADAARLRDALRQKLDYLGAQVREIAEAV